MSRRCPTTIMVVMCLAAFFALLIGLGMWVSAQGAAHAVEQNNNRTNQVLRQIRQAESTFSNRHASEKCDIRLTD